MLDVIVVGGGISGLSTAWRASEAGHSVLVLESSAKLGGVISSESRTEGVLEHGPDALLLSRPPLRALLDDLELSSQTLSPLPSRPWLARDGRLHPLPEGFRTVAPTKLLPFVRTPLLSWWGKFRLLWDLVLPASPLKDQTLAQLIGRRFGHEVLEQMAQPLLGGIYASDPQEMSLAATMPHFLKLEQEYGSLIKGLWKSSAAPPKMGSLPRGLGQLIESLSQKLEGKIQTEAAVTRLTHIPEGWLVEAGERTWQARQVVVATSAPHCARLLGDVDPVLEQSIGRIVCRDVAVINLLFEAHQLGAQPPDCQGFLLPLKESALFSAVSLTHQKWPDRVRAGLVNLRLHLGGAGREEILGHDDETLLELAKGELARWLKVDGEPSSIQLRRHSQAMPEYRLGHIDTMRRVEERLADLPGLHLTGNWISGVGISECVARAERLTSTLSRPAVEAL